MGWLQRLFGQEAPDNTQDIAAAGASASADTSEEIPPERVGLNGEYDQNGLAKRVALAFDQDPSLEDINTLWVGQLGGTVVLKGEVPSQDILDQIVAIASSVDGATNVTSDEVIVG